MTATQKPNADRPLAVDLVHLELGLGGAERLMVDAAAALAQRGHRVRILTTRHPRASFPETNDGSIPVEVHGDWLPRHAGGRFIATFSILRSLWLARALASTHARPDVILTDLVAHTVPALKRACGVPVVYYGHYPDQLLAPPATGLRRAYRALVDGAEARGLAAADGFLVNSQFTARAFARLFPTLRTPAIVNPGVDLARFAHIQARAEPEVTWLLAIQRFDPSKNVELAVETLAVLKALRPDRPVKLALAGRLDTGQPECVALKARLLARAAALGVAADVVMVEDPSDEEIAEWLARAALLIYTPVEEHFGIVPLEAMAAGLPVVACRGGGLLETVVDGETGLLVAPDVHAFADACKTILDAPDRARAMGVAGRRRAADFSRERFGERLQQALQAVLTGT